MNSCVHHTFYDLHLCIYNHPPMDRYVQISNDSEVSWTPEERGSYRTTAELLIFIQKMEKNVVS
jgi:hypothetical protein